MWLRQIVGWVEPFAKPIAVVLNNDGYRFAPPILRADLQALRNTPFCPTGKSLIDFAAVLSSPRRKNFLIFRNQNRWYIYGCLAPSRGAARDRHGRWERDAVDADGALTRASIRGR
jgi:hypothetical protein